MNGPSVGAYPALSALGGLLAVHAHPDDETLSTGGVLAAWAAAGQPVCVVTCTRGERGEVIARPGTTSEGRAGLEGDGPALGAYREIELARALAELGGGAVEHAFLDTLPSADPRGTGVATTSDPVVGPRYEDSGMAWVAPGVAGPAPDSPPTAFARVPLDETAGRLASLIRARRPAVVVTYEPGGGYGHPDHVRAHQVTASAVELAAEPDWRPELWLAVAPADEVREALATLAALPPAAALAAAEGLTFADRTGDLPPFARENLADIARWSVSSRTVSPRPTTEDALVVRVDVGPVLDRVTAALRSHATQVQHATLLARPQGPVAGWYALSNDVLAPILGVETYLVSAPGGRPAR